MIVSQFDIERERAALTTTTYELLITNLDVKGYEFGLHLHTYHPGLNEMAEVDIEGDSSSEAIQLALVSQHVYTANSKFTIQPQETILVRVVPTDIQGSGPRSVFERAKGFVELNIPILGRDSNGNAIIQGDKQVSLLLYATKIKFDNSDNGLGAMDTTPIDMYSGKAHHEVLPDQGFPLGDRGR